MTGRWTLGPESGRGRAIQKAGGQVINETSAKRLGYGRATLDARGYVEQENGREAGEPEDTRGLTGVSRVGVSLLRESSHFLSWQTGKPARGPNRIELPSEAFEHNIESDFRICSLDARLFRR